MTIINARSVSFSDDVVKKIISREYGVNPREVHLDVYEKFFDTDRFTFGYYIHRDGYNLPVCYQNEAGQLVFIRKDDYFKNKYFKEIEEKQIPVAAKKRA